MALSAAGSCSVRCGGMTNRFLGINSFVQLTAHEILVGTSTGKSNIYRGDDFDVTMRLSLLYRRS